MKGDFSRNTFDTIHHFTRVLLQQGRVSVDADFNEQASILLHRLQSFTADLLGTDSYSGAGPASDMGFQISASSTTGDFTIGAGRYYVNGILVENESANYTYLNQPNYPVPVNKQLTGVTDTLMVYLDVWERHLTALEAPGIREVALGGPDTASRAEVIWQVKVISASIVNGGTNDKKGATAAATADLRTIAARATSATTTKVTGKSATGANPTVPTTLLTQDFPIPFGLEALRARAKQNPPDTDPCTIPPASAYRGLENQLYRVEIHRGGLITDNPTFKWSRENGSVIFSILKIASDATSSTTTVFLTSLGRDQKLGLAVGDWVEIVDDAYALQNLAEPLLQVASISLDDQSVTLSGLRVTGNRGDDPNQHPLLRRWDQSGSGLSYGAQPITEGIASVDANWITLEDGVQILFDNSAISNGVSFYRTGDYWLIPARVATGDVEWPEDATNAPAALPPQGVEHQFVGLARILVANGTVTVNSDQRNFFDVLSKPMS